MCEEKIKKDMEYCLNCKTKPCQKGCPLSNDIPTFIKLAKDEKIEEAYESLINTTMLGSICGRICPHTKQCQGHCVRGIKGEPVNIGKIEAYVFDQAIKNGYDKKIKKSEILKGKKIAIIGSGPAGLSCSSFLAIQGADVTIYEKNSKLGGILTHGIPDFRIDKIVIESTISSILNLGIKVEYQQELGKDITIEELKKSYDAIFLGLGANISTEMNIEGENLRGVYGGNALLEKNEHPNYEGKKVAIVGGGNVAMDCARTIQRQNPSKVYVIYRRSEKQMPAETKEIEAAKKEGVEFLFQNNIIKILGKDKVKQIECIKTELIKIDGEEREVPVNIENSNYLIDVDYVVMAIGSKPQKDILSKLNLELNKYGYIKVNERYQTSDKKIYAGGDLIGQKATVAWAAMAGREAAKSIVDDLK